MEQGTITIASKRAEPLTNGTLRSFSPCSDTPNGTTSSVDLLRGDLFRVSAHDEVNLVRSAVNLSQQTLQVNRPAGAGRGDDKFHPAKESHSAEEH